jgi:hypothetical protein
MTSATSLASHEVTKLETSLVTPEEYVSLLRDLVAKGAFYGKTKDVAAYQIRDLHFVTENEEKQDEVSKDVEFKEKLMMTFDLKFWPTEYSRHLAVKDVAMKWAGRMVGERDLNHPDFKGPGMWTSKKSNFDFDYVKVPTDADGQDDLYAPNPEGRRLCMQVKDAARIPTGWGETFLVPANGTLAVRERDLPKLVHALEKIAGGAKPEDVLYTDQPASGSAAIDVYGMMPKFLAQNYGLVAAKPESQAVLATFRTPGAAGSSGPAVPLAHGAGVLVKDTLG